MNKIITIGREFGSGGRELGRRLAEELGIAYYDREIITEIAKRTDLSEQYVQSVMENKPTLSYPIHTSMSFSVLPYSSYIGSSLSIYEEQQKLLKELAEKSDCLIVGRCADYILRDYNPYKIFVYAEPHSKIARCRSKMNESESFTDKQIAKRIAKIDKNRAKYYTFFTGQKWGDKLNYNLCVNTTDCDISQIVPHIAKML